MATEVPDTAARAEGEWAVMVAEEWEPPRAVVVVAAWVDRAAVVEAWAVRVVVEWAVREAEERAGEAGRVEPGSREESLRSMGRWKTQEPTKEARLSKAETRVRAALPDKGDEDRAGRWASPRLRSL